MGVRESSSAFTYHVLKNIDQEVINSLTKGQLKAIYEGISASKPYEKHLVDIRGIIPLFFCRLYFVVLAGQDIRPKIRSQDELRRSNADVLMNTVVMMFLSIPIILLFALFCYFLKVEYGINYIVGFHLLDLFKYKWFE